MKAHLLYRARDIDLQWPLPWNEQALTQDLALNTLFKAMAQGDKFVLEVVRKVLLSGFDNDLETIHYRQNILQDCLHHPAIVRELYSVAVEAMEKERSYYFGSLMRYPDWVLRQSIELLEAFLDVLKKLRRLLISVRDMFVSEGWRAFFAILQKELSDDFFAKAQYHLEQLKFRNGVLLSAELGKGNKGNCPYLGLRQGVADRSGWVKRFRRHCFRTLGTTGSSASRSIHVTRSGFKALAELQGPGNQPVSPMRWRNLPIMYAASSKCCGRNWLSTSVA